MSILVVQMGHVARTSGATGTRGEQAFARAAGERVKHHVERMGHEVRLILADPPSVAEYRGDAFVAIHCDGGAPQTRGGSVGYRTAEGQKFAHGWMKHYEGNGWPSGFRPDNYTANLSGYYGVKRAVEQGNRRAFIAESGFMTNEEDRALLDSPEGHDRFGLAVCGSLIDLGWCQCPSDQPAPPPPPPAKLRVDPATAPVLRAKYQNGKWRVGSTGLGAFVFQKMINATSGRGLLEDGLYGRTSREACWDFQAFFGLYADGVCGKKTWGLLNHIMDVKGL